MAQRHGRRNAAPTTVARTAWRDGARLRGRGHSVTAATIDTPLPIVGLVEPDYEPDLTIQQRYELWIAANAWVLDAIESLIDRWLAAGHKRVGIKQMWEVIRFEYGATTGDRFRANNTFTSRVARDLLERR